MMIFGIIGFFSGLLFYFMDETYNKELKSGIFEE
jgi:hypothetical protein